MAESAGKSGQDLILAAALGFEVVARVSSAIGSPPWHFEGPEGKLVQPKRVGKISPLSLGAVAGAGKILNLNQEKIAHAMGIASHLGQSAGTVVFMSGPHRTMQKWGIAGGKIPKLSWPCYWLRWEILGDTLVFDPEHNTGYEEWQPDRMIHGLGKTWNFNHVNYKPTLAAGCFTLHWIAFIVLWSQTILAEQIESIKVYSHPQLEENPTFTLRDLHSIVDVQYSIPYTLALAAYKIKIGVEWQDMDLVREPRIVKFADKVLALSLYDRISFDFFVRLGSLK